MKKKLKKMCKAIWNNPNSRMSFIGCTRDEGHQEKHKAFIDEERGQLFIWSSDSWRYEVL